jgi:hypothetical protein
LADLPVSLPLMAGRTLLRAASRVCQQAMRTKPSSLRRTRIGFALAAVILAAVCLIPTITASAAPIRNCGNYGYPKGYRGKEPIFTHKEIVGAGVYKIRTRVARCTTARRMVRAFWSGRWDCDGDGQVCRRGSYRCRNRQLGEEHAVMRCNASRGRVVRFEYGA